ncbi:molybdate transporter family protein [Fodinicurvata halophila]|uniref:Molybdate transporter family protein n=1 Tax=Fodinicurvata halophila TaxID=1419723 RepID=A0ABV8URC1_9PROT
MKRIAGEVSGAFGDLGMFLPHVLGAITVAGLAPLGVLFGFGLFLVASGLFYAIPMAVQPMKAVSAIMLTGQLDPASIAATGLVLGLVFLVLGVTGWIDRLARLIPQSVTAGLQLGLGLSLALLGLDLVMETPWLGLLVLALLLGLLALKLLAAMPLVLLGAVGLGLLAGTAELPGAVTLGGSLPAVTLPGWGDLLLALELTVLPQLALTLTNAVIVAAALARQLYPRAAGRATERNLSLSTGLANLLLAPLGALPMCHGAGGLQAQHRFGARSGLAPIVFGSLLLLCALFLSQDAAAILGAIPLAAVGALLVIAGGDLAFSRRLLDARPNCWPAMGTAAALTLLVNPAVGLLAGCAVEGVRASVKRHLHARRKGH